MGEEQDEVGGAFLPSGDAELVVGCRGFEQPGADEPPLPVVSKHRHPTARPASDEQVLPAVPIEVEPGHPRPGMAEAVRQQGLTGKIIEGESTCS